LQGPDAQSALVLHWTQPSAALQTWLLAPQLVCGATQAPEPLQAPAAVKVVPEHEALPHEVPEATCSQTPPAAQLPSLPQGGLAMHWPAGAALPEITFAQVPSAEPVSAIVQAWQVAVQAASQQTPPTQKPLEH